MKQSSESMIKHKQQESAQEATVKSLIELLEGGSAHITFKAAVSDIPAKYRGVNPEGIPYSIWDLVVHIRIAQWDILEFSRNPKHHSLTWPEDYWPSDEMPPGEVDWQYNLKHIEKDKKEFIDLLQDPANDLYKPFPYGDGQNLMREALLIADHTAYHVGQIIVVRRILGIW